MDIAALAISGVGLALSLFLAVRGGIQSREAYSVAVVDYKQPAAGIVQLLICIVNRSASPLAVVSVSLCGAECELFPKRIRGTPGSFDFRHTADFPLCIPSRGCRYAYLEFLHCPLPPAALAPGKTLPLEIRTTRRRGRKTVRLGSQSRYLHSSL